MSLDFLEDLCQLRPPSPALGVMFLLSLDFLGHKQALQKAEMPQMFLLSLDFLPTSEFLIRIGGIDQMFLLSLDFLEN